MYLPWRDVVATVCVGIAVLIYGAWLIGFGLPIVGEVSALALAILVLGMIASMSAVVPGFAELLSGSRVYLAASSLVGAAALAGGLWAFFNRDATALAVLVLATVVLWAMSTWRHVSEHQAEIA